MASLSSLASLEGFAEKTSDLIIGTRDSMEGAGDSPGPPRSLSMASIKTSFVANTLPLDWPEALHVRPGFEQGGRGQSLLFSSEADSGIFKSRTFVVKPEEELMVARPSIMERQCSRLWWLPRCSCASIDPSSRFHMVYSFFSLAVLIFDLTVLPFVLAWEIPFVGFLKFAAWATPCFWSADVAINFLTGYYEDGELELRKSRIARRYLRTWFLADCSVLLCDWASMSMFASLGDDNSAQGSMRMLRITKLARLLRILGMVRMVRLARILEEFAETHLSEGYRLVFKISSFFLSIMWGAHILSCLWWIVGRSGPTDTGVRWVDDAGPLLGDSHTSFSATGTLYQYASAFHWSAAQIALGSVDLYPKNSCELLVNVVGMMLGFLLGSTLVSSLSAAMVDFQMMQKDRTMKLRSLRQYLRENEVEQRIAVPVRKQAELRLWKQERLQEKDVPVLALLSSTLRMELRYEIQRPHLVRHPLIRLWISTDADLVQRVCSKAFVFTFLRTKDDLFLTGSAAGEAYFLVEGALSYIQDPLTSAVAEETTLPVGVGTWICEAALWSDWTHVGKMEAVTSSQLLALQADKMAEMLKKNLMIYDITLEYCKHFYKRIVSAKPPHAPWPTDLHVPFTDYCDLVVSMAKEVQVTIGLDALHHLSAAGRAPKGLSKLKEEVDTAKSLVVVTGDGDIVRVVSIVALRVERRDGSIFAQIGKRSGHSEIAAACQLPGLKQERDELVSEAVRHVFNTRLPLLAGKVDIARPTRENREKESKEYGILTRYLRTICHASLREGEEELQGLVNKPRDMESEPTVQKITSGYSVPGLITLSVLCQHDVYEVRDEESSVSNFFAWIDPDVFDFLSTPTGEPMLKSWLSAVEQALDDERQQQHAPEDSIAEHAINADSEFSVSAFSI